MDAFRAFGTADITKRDVAIEDGMKTIPQDPSKRDYVKRVVEGQYKSLLKLWLNEVTAYSFLK